MIKNIKKTVKQKGLIRKIHFQAIAFLVIYTLLSKSIFIKSITSPSLAVAFSVPYIFGIVAGILFLYLFNHEDFFHFMREVERVEKKKEEGYLKRYIHFGRIFSTLIIGGIGGPVFAALTVRFLLNNFPHRYLLLAVANIGSTLLAVVIAKGAIGLIF